MKPFIDRILALSISKKLTVFILGTLFLFKESITSEQWIQLSIMYIGTQGVIDLFKEYFKK